MRAIDRILRARRHRHTRVVHAINALFRKAEPGVWFEAHDPASYFGPELATNSWYIPTSYDNTISNATASGFTTTAGTTNGQTRVAQRITTVAGRTYTVRTASSLTTPVLYARDVADTGTILASKGHSAVGVIYDFSFVAASSDTYLLYVQNPNAAFSVSGFSVREVLTDLVTAWQDFAGQTPVTAVEQPLGMWRDLSRGVVMGPELAVNPGPSAEWTANGGGSWTKATTAAAGTLSFNGNALGSGEWAELKFTVSNISGGGITAYIGGAAVATITAAGTYTYKAPAGSSTVTDCSFYAASTSLATVSAVSCRAMPGIHATQSTSADRPVLSARVNLLEKTASLTDGYWSKLCSNATPVPVVTDGQQAPDGTLTASRVQLTPPGDGEWSLVRRSNVGVTVKAGGVLRQRIMVRATDSSQVGKWVNLYTYNVTSLTYNEVSKIQLTLDWQEFVNPATFAADANGQEFSFGKARGGVSNGLTNAQVATDFMVAWPDFRFAADINAGPAYQRVTTPTDYDTAGFLHYVKFNGSNQSLSTGNINLTGTDKVTVFAGVMKLSDGAAGSIAELGSGVDNSPGAVGLFAAGATGDASRRTWQMGGYAGSINYGGATLFVSPDVRVITATWDTAQVAQTDEMKMRLNGVQQTLTFGSAAVLTGNFGNLPLHIGRRAGTALPLNGRITCVGLRGAASSDGLIATTERYINRRTGAYA